jgi:eukaryotic-like serine/threonine-protein kinase
VETGEPSPSRTFDPGDLVGDLIADRFRVHRLVSTGANTAIYDASDEENGRTVTLKLVRPKLTASPSFRNRFDETMRAVAALSHPNIAAVYDWGVARVADTSTAYVVNEHLAGGSLRDMFDRGRRLSPSQALAVGLDVCRALDHAHRRRFVHAELNPSKIVFGDDRRLRVIDFGLARLLSAPNWERPDSVPTHVAWYAAPEQGLGGQIDGRADVYALCLTLHEAVTGTVPFKSDSTVASLTARVGKLMPVSADLGPLASVLERAGRPDHDERSSAAEFGKGLLQAAAKLPRPEPLPLLSSGLFDTPVEQLRDPDDPTGGVFRPGAGTPLVLVPLDEPDTDESLDGDTAGDTDTSIIAAASGAEPGVDSSGEVALASIEPSASPGETHDAPRDIPAHPTSELPDHTGDLVITPLDAAPDRTPQQPVTGAESGDLLIDTTTTVPTAPLAVLAEAESMPRRRRGFPWKVLLGLFVVAALVALGVLAMQLFQRPTYPVPDLVGVPEAEALNLIAANNWLVDVQSERSDVVPVIGQVVRTAPAAGVELAEGEPFLMVVSQGPLLRTLPESTGVLASEATTTLVALRLQVDTVEQFDEVVPAGTVISWSVPGDPTLAAGAEVEPETVVQLVVSLGPAPRVVPNLVGRPLAEARAELESVQLSVVEVEQVFSDDIPLGSVVAQSVPEGSEVERGTTVAVALSRGPDLVAYPDISTAPSFEAAAVVLRDAGFEPVLVFGSSQGLVQQARIGGNEPVVGNLYRRGAVVEITALLP